MPDPTPTEMRHHARELIDRSLPAWRDVRGYVDDEIPQTDEDERKTLVHNLNAYIRAATITITWDDEPEEEAPGPLGWMAMARWRPGGDYRPGAVADYHDNPADAQEERDTWVADGLDAIVVALVPIATTQESTP